MERILYDTYIKGDKPIWDLDLDNPSTREFNRKILAANRMYEWLYAQGILKKVSFECRDYSDMSFFALDVEDLQPYRKQMEQSGLLDADIAVHHIFDEKYTACMYSGAFQIGWTMRSYRSFDGTVGRSWECDLIRHLDSPTVLDILEIQNREGVKAAISTAFELSEFEPSDL